MKTQLACKDVHDGRWVRLHHVVANYFKTEKASIIHSLRDNGALKNLVKRRRLSAQRFV
jgi:hypothetical protein